MTTLGNSGLYSGRAILLLAIAGMVTAGLTGCGSSATSSTAASSTATHPAATPVASPITVGTVSVNVRCTGVPSSKPAIVLVAGSDDPLTKFAAVQETLSATTRVCSYDRPGEGASPAPATTQTLADTAQLLSGVIRAERIRGKIVIVGHSLGGLIAANYAHTFPHRVAGVVLLDATAPSVGPALLRLIPASATGPAAGARAEVDTFLSPAKNPEKLLYRGQPIGSLGSTPLTVVQHGKPIYTPVPIYGKALQAIWSRGQHLLAGLSTRSRLLTAKDSGHYIYLDQSALTVKLIEDATTV